MQHTLEELHQESRDVIENFQRHIEPRLWDERILTIELGGEVGSLTHALLDQEGYKRHEPKHGAIQDECSDVIFIIIRLMSHYHCSFDLIELASPPESLTIEDAALELTRLAGLAAAFAQGDRTISLPAILLQISTIVDWIANYYNFSLDKAYLAELRICRIYQVKTLADLKGKRLLHWFKPLNLGRHHHD